MHEEQKYSNLELLSLPGFRTDRADRAVWFSGQMPPADPQELARAKEYYDSEAEATLTHLRAMYARCRRQREQLSDLSNEQMLALEAAYMRHRQIMWHLLDPALSCDPPDPHEAVDEALMRRLTAVYPARQKIVECAFTAIGPKGEEHHHYSEWEIQYLGRRCANFMAEVCSMSEATCRAWLIIERTRERASRTRQRVRRRTDQRIGEWVPFGWGAFAAWVAVAVIASQINLWAYWYPGTPSWAVYVFMATAVLTGAPILCVASWLETSGKRLIYYLRGANVPGR